MYIPELTMPQFEQGLLRTRSVLVPIGATEEHGQHLPLDTDTLQAIAVARKLAEKRPLFVAPPVHYGVCRSTYDHPGTLSIGTETLKRLVVDIGLALYRQGLRQLVFLTGHAGGTHGAALIDAGETLLNQCPEAQIAVLTEYQLAAERGRELIETAGDSHAGEIETSRILHTHPHLVNGTSAEEYPTFPSGILVRNKRHYWPGGVWGNPAKATARKGAQIEALVVDALEKVVETLEQLAEGSDGTP